MLEGKQLHALLFISKKSSIIRRNAKILIHIYLCMYFSLRSFFVTDNFFILCVCLLVSAQLEAVFHSMFRNIMMSMLISQFYSFNFFREIFFHALISILISLSVK